MQSYVFVVDERSERQMYRVAGFVTFKFRRADRFEWHLDCLFREDAMNTQMTSLARVFRMCIDQVHVVGGARH